MRVALLHNETAGSEDHTDAQLLKLLRRSGHEITAIARSVQQLTAALQSTTCDLVVIAGGDGTVGRTASELAGWGVPLSILPLGTANNTARCLGVSGKLSEVVKGWAQAVPRPFDLAFVSDGGVRLRFSEAAGWGLFPAVIGRAKRMAKPDHPKRTLKRDRRLFLRALENHRPAFYRLEIDGRDRSGNYLLLEVANIGLIGPRLEISPHSNPSDGQLEVILAGESDRAMLIHLIENGQCPEALPRDRGTHVRLSSEDGMYHRDGGLVRYPRGVRTFDVHVEASAVSYLTARR